MGKVFLEHLGGTHIYKCAKCFAYLTHIGLLDSRDFTGNTGRAYLFSRVVNVIHGESHEKHMLTGFYMIRDVLCKSCKYKLGWMYEFASDIKQKDKEGKVVLERLLIYAVDEPVMDDPEESV